MTLVRLTLLVGLFILITARQARFDALTVAFGLVFFSGVLPGVLVDALMFAMVYAMVYALFFALIFVLAVSLVVVLAVSLLFALAFALVFPGLPFAFRYRSPCGLCVSSRMQRRYARSPGLC